MVRSNQLKMAVLLAMALVLAFGAPAMAWLNVSSPAGGEVWNKGQTYTIQWEDTGCVANINLCKGREAFDDCSYKTFVASGISGNSYQYTVSLSEFADEFKFEIWVDCNGIRKYGYSGYFQVPGGSSPPVSQTGSIQVNIYPAEAVNAGAQYQVDGGAWHNSGEVVTNLSVETHSIDFKAISGWNVPNSLTMSVTANQTNSTGASYTPKVTPPTTEYGNLQVLINYQAVNAGAQWQVDGGTWQASGTTLSLPIGNHTITFKQISGWITPSPKTLYISNVVNTQWKGDYTLQSTPNTTGKRLDVPLYGQGQHEEPWGPDNLGTCSSTLSQAGCAVTSIAMVFRYYGVNTDPREMNNWLTLNGGYDVDKGCIVRWIVAVNHSEGKVESYQGTANDLSLIKSEIDNGHPVIAGVTYLGGEHFVVITGYTDDTLYINDPVYNDSSTINERYGDPITAIHSLRIYRGSPSPLPTGNTEPQYVSGSVNGVTNLGWGYSGGSFRFETTWKDAENDSIVDVECRYKKVGTSLWTIIPLGFISGNPPKFGATVVIADSPGMYDYQFKASDANPADAPRKHTTEWKGGGIFEVKASNGGIIPTQILSPVVGKIKDVNGGSFCPSGDVWCFNQHRSDQHTPNGFCGSDDTEAWDANLNYPDYNTDAKEKEVYAVADGVVVAFDTCENYTASGQVLISHDNGTWWSAYFHMKDIQVKIGESVNQNRFIGKISNVSPFPVTEHLHFVVYKGENKKGYLKSFDAQILARESAPPQSTTLFRSSSTIATSGTDRKAVAMTSASKGLNSFSLYFPSIYTRKKGLRESPSELDLIITTPSGKVLAPDSPEVKDYVSTDNKKSYTVDVQETGEWIAEIVAVRVPPEGESYSFEVVKLDGAIDPAIDTDNDGIPDAWEYEHGLNPLVNDESTDSDNDGYSNLDEYKAGTDPNDPASKPVSPVCSCIADGLAACYTFDGNANDNSGNGNNGIAQGSVGYVAGVNGSAVKFGGIDSPGDILVKNNTSLQFSQGLTVASYIKISDPIAMDGYGKKAVGGYNAIVAKGHDRRGFYMKASIDASNLLDTRGGNNVYTSVPFFFGNATSADKKDKWVHIAYVVGNGFSKIFLDGVLITPSTGPVDFSIANQQDLYIGKFSDLWYPSGAAMDNLLIYNRALSDAEIKQLYSGICEPEPPNPPTTPGTFTVDESGIVKIDWLYDGGKYQGEFGIFNLAGMEDLTPGSSEFIAEAVKRVLSNSEQGYLVFSDLSEGARFSGILGNEIRDWNAGAYKGLKSFAMPAGTQFATILVPNSTFQSLAQNPATADTNKRPLFSLVSDNPGYGTHIGQMADINGMGKAFAYEDKNAESSDWDFNDLVLLITGADSNLPTLDSLVGKDVSRSKREKRDNAFTDWRTGSELGKLIMSHIEASAPTEDSVSMTVTLNVPATLLVYDPSGKVIGKEGGTIAGANFELKADGTQIVTFPNMNPGDYRISVQGTASAQGTLTVKTYQGNAELSSDDVAVSLAAHQTMTLNVSSDSEQPFTVGTPAVAESYDFNGDGVTDNADVSMIVRHWNSCRNQQKYDPFYDLNDDGCITVADVMKVLNAKTVK